jgi:hypothetical protein
MKKHPHCTFPANEAVWRSLFRTAWLSGLLCLSALAVARGQARYSQTVALSAGWNAVYLDVDPAASVPNELFAGLPIDVVAAYVPSTSRAQFVESPNANLLGSYGWSVWYAAHRADAFLSNLHAIYGAKAYLIHATTNASMVVNGTFAPRATAWIPDAYNFVGYTVQAPGGPTYQQFFQGSPAHNHNKIYRLVDGTWRQVLSPGTVAMRPGEAFWIYCDGHSKFAGPLEATTSSQMGLFLSSASGGELTLRNQSGHPLKLFLEHDTEGNDPIPLNVPVQAFDEEAKVLRTLHIDLGSGNWTKELPVLEAGAAIRLPFNLRLQDMEPGTRHSLLKVRTDSGTIHTIPVHASREGER